MKLTKPHAARLPDATSESVRKVTDQQIAELQNLARQQILPGDAPAGLRLLRPPTLLTASTGTHTLAPGTCVVIGVSQGAGGGGGGAQGGANQAAGAGGGAGVQVHWQVGTPGTPIASRSCSYTCGARGAGGAGAGGNGGTGGDATITVAGNAITAKGATGGGGMTSSTLATSFGGIGQTGSSLSTTLTLASVRGSMGFVVGGGPFSGAGASCLPYGTGGAPASLGVGGDAAGFGAGGGGGNATAADKAGGAGAPACHEIWELG